MRVAVINYGHTDAKGIGKHIQKRADEVIAVCIEGEACAAGEYADGAGIAKLILHARDAQEMEELEYAAVGDADMALVLGNSREENVNRMRAYAIKKGIRVRVADL